MKEKRELIRVVKAPDITDESGSVTAKGDIMLDSTGKKPGRGAYLCRSAECFRLARKSKRLERSFSCKIPDRVYDSLEEALEADER